MQTLNQLSTLPFENNLVLNGLNLDDKSSMVYDFSNGWNVLDLIVSYPEILNGKRSRCSGMLTDKFPREPRILSFDGSLHIASK